MLTEMLTKAVLYLTVPGSHSVRELHEWEGHAFLVSWYLHSKMCQEPHIQVLLLVLGTFALSIFAIDIFSTSTCGHIFTAVIGLEAILP